MGKKLKQLSRYKEKGLDPQRASSIMEIDFAFMAQDNAGGRGEYWL